MRCVCYCQACNCSLSRPRHGRRPACPIPSLEAGRTGTPLSNCTKLWISLHIAACCRAVLLAFSRDASVMHTAEVAATPLMVAATSQGAAQELPQAYPASGVLPFHGLCPLLAPLCYLFSSPAAIYPVWRAMYCRYWCYLHTLNSNTAPSAGLPVLCRTFLDLLQVMAAFAVVQLRHAGRSCFSDVGLQALRC